MSPLDCVRTAAQGPSGSCCPSELGAMLSSHVHSQRFFPLMCVSSAMAPERCYWYVWYWWAPDLVWGLHRFWSCLTLHVRVSSHWGRTPRAVWPGCLEPTNHWPRFCFAQQWTSTSCVPAECRKSFKTKCTERKKWRMWIFMLFPTIMTLQQMLAL